MIADSDERVVCASAEHNPLIREEMKKATAILGIAAPVSWVLVPLLGFMCS